MTRSVEEVVRHWPGWKINKGSAQKPLKDGRLILVKERGHCLVVMLAGSNPDRWNQFDKNGKGAMKALDHANFMAGLYGGWAEE